MAVIESIVFLLLTTLNVYSNDVPTDAELLARLLVAEVDVMEPSVRNEAGLSILSTVFWHLEAQDMGTTIEDILSVQYNGYWAFPPEVTIVDCEWLVDQRRCLENKDLTWAYITLQRYVSGERGECNGYPAYHAMESQPVDCVVSDGYWEARFHDGWGYVEYDMLDILQAMNGRIKME